MAPYLLLFGKPISTYSLCILLGGVLAWLWFHHSLRTRPENPGTVEQAFFWGILGAFLGSKILFLLTCLPQLIRDLPLLQSDSTLFAARYLYSGFVFYGGLLGTLGVVWLFCRHRRLSFSGLCAVLVPAVPLLHACGRVGCFFAGCCYGIPAPEGWPGITFHRSFLAPNQVPLVPVQLMEAAGVFLLFLLLACLAKKCWQGNALLLLYLTAYAPLRFALEFFRGDAYRGHWGILSTSQLIALLTLAVSLPLLVRGVRRQKKPTPPPGQDTTPN